MKIQFDKSEINKYNYADKDKEIIFLKDQVRELNRQIKQLRNIIKDLQKSTNQIKIEK